MKKNTEALANLKIDSERLTLEPMKTEDPLLDEEMLGEREEWAA